ncbi:MAG: phosphoglycerate kinase [Candidatus Vogelbacteria bacterium CG22_combo_CG10-13_8_21_14_all_37_9]|uniref:Phosphoglycerate kinase n=1 Tax=Candidatus Vogelbacteria bacterium CG22_combo_CG10-13_8_21_14_all_37_9 TaxID=1975046 RepID=A0A2H0BKR0_9BACT|nr:MAG: phosphoglycerate kinase [bacterium CG10_37_50]PIP58265.1 MAG: phosphoglycerate kinase [Candidatus Vogelbacteria bacterium CG22_combo_CG10-13_8_21_14_all_37_9]
MKYLTTLTKKDLIGKRVLVRVDYNVPIRKNKVTEAFRIDESLATIKFLLKNGARVILISHLGSDGKASLAPVAKYLATKKLPVKLLKDFKAVQKSTSPLILLENIRRFEGELNNSPILAKQLASLADLFVNDAFSVSHRLQASVVGVPKFLPSFVGLALEREVDELVSLVKPAGPLVLVIGGVKFSTKLPLLQKFLNKAEFICVGGALANTLLSARGIAIGISVTEKLTPNLIKLAKNRKIILPIDAVVQTGKKIAVKNINYLNPNDKIVDIGPMTVKLFTAELLDTRIILWNGPLGLTNNGFSAGTIGLAKALPKKSFSVLGGGDSLAVLRQAKLLTKFSFVSTGGGALLDYLVHGTLPGLKALR